MNARRARRRLREALELMNAGELLASASLAVGTDDGARLMTGARTVRALAWTMVRRAERDLAPRRKGTR